MDSKENVNQVILGFRNFLNKSWNAFYQQLEFVESNTDELFRDDQVTTWLQVNWEILVEQALCKPTQFIEVYWKGADVYLSGRVIRYYKAEATHKVVCYPKSKDYCLEYFSKKKIKPQLLFFLKFVTYDPPEIHYKDGPPFDFVLLEDSACNLYIVRVNDVIFKLESVPPQKPKD